MGMGLPWGIWGEEVDHTGRREGRGKKRGKSELGDASSRLRDSTS